jgi:hypothetical protein
VLCSGIHDERYALIRKDTRDFLLEGSVHDIITGCIEYLQYYRVVSKYLIVVTRSKICMLINEHPLQIREQKSASAIFWGWYVRDIHIPHFGSSKLHFLCTIISGNNLFLLTTS